MLHLGFPRRFIIGAAVALTLACSSTMSSTMKDWMGAEDKDTVEAYRQFITEHPACDSARVAAARITELIAYSRADSVGTDAAYEKFMGAFPNGRLRQFAVQSRVRLWEKRESAEQERMAKNARTEGGRRATLSRVSNSIESAWANISGQMNTYMNLESLSGQERWEAANKLVSGVHQLREDVEYFLRNAAPGDPRVATVQQLKRVLDAAPSGGGR